MKIATGNRRTDKKWKNREISWEDFCLKISSTLRTTETVEEYRKMKKGQQDNIKDVGGFVGGHLKEGRRRNGYVLCRSMLTLDMDYATPDIWEQIKLLYDFKCCVYSTHKHTEDHPRLRLIIPLSRDISEDEYPAVGRMVAQDIGMDLFDDTTYEPCRLMYWPSTPVNGVFFSDVKDGILLDPDSYLARYHDWRDVSTWPVSSRQSEVIKRTVKAQADPLTKDGIVGTFCRTYTVTEAIDKFLSGIYAPSAAPDRYDYIPADSSAGVVIYDDKFAYSHHATDPASGQLLNAFDVVRVHKFKDADEKTGFKEMADFAIRDERVKQTILEERKCEVVSDFTENDTNWESRLEYEPRTMVIKNTLGNLRLILENDPNLKAIVFNQQLDGMEIKGRVPWNHPSKYWRDADDAQLISYIDSRYGTFSARNYEIAVTKVADDRSYHPIREYLSSLPEWDGELRVDTLLVDYLGAEDNEYVRAVTRKILCAAVCRVMNPGCKFDSMLVLNGPQGVGKSTLISKLAGEWFSDSLNLSDTKDKTAAEKLQGYWIMEIGELAGLRKAEVETLRSFLSRQNDVYRASFGRRATPHPRQCVFFGTTNAESGYLRDTTGNRRFWPIKTPGTGVKHSWDMTQNDIDQIWAEVMVYVKNGETLHLSPELESLAKAEQREAMESDEREGLVRDYLETLLPAEWDSMSLYERRNFLNGSEFGGDTHTGTVARTSVTNMEIWCECFGKERANLKRTDSNELTVILTKLGWKRMDTKQRVALYGPQYVFVPKPETN